MSATPDQDPPLSVARSDLALHGARRLVASVTDAARVAGRSVSVAVVDTAGVLVAFERMDGAPRFSADLATSKARTAMTFGRPTSAMEATFADRPAFASSFVLQGDWYLGRGGFPVVLDGVVVGGVGVSGDDAEREEDLARSAAESLSGGAGPGSGHEGSPSR
jgi:uncharacterized protein GlcG (DUF336 family)